ncbi:MAG: S41 family peptidase [Saprospiraceae bacterium]|nr:S41 family peptidase [Saprospiraceae bacterium]
MKRILTVFLVVGLLFSFKKFADPNRYFEITKNLELFANLYKELNYYYVDDIEPGKLMRTGIDAMLNSLDPYTNYFSEAQVESYRFLTEGKYHGIGAGMQTIDGLPTITELFEESPAYKSGLKLADQITAIGGKSVIGKSKEEIDSYMQGSADTHIDLQVRRPGEPKELNFSVNRGEVDVPNVPYSGMVSDKIGYINLTVFSDQAGNHVSTALQKLKKEHAELTGLILDLRGNGGGLLREAVNICNIFIPKNELVVTTKGKVKEWDRAFKTMQNPVDEKIPLVILVDKGTASASEIVSGVVQDLDRGVIMGQSTYGKGLVQNTREIGYNSQVKLTTAKYYIPSGRCIQAVEYENGEPKNIPDSLRADFKTRAGRKVLDGGGIRPDVPIDSENFPEILQELMKQHLVFKYATHYTLQHKEINPVKEFKFNDYDEFKKYLKNARFNFNSSLEKSLEAFKDKAAQDPTWTQIQAEYQHMYAKVKADPDQLLDKHKVIIIKQLEKEIIPRYYLQKGKIEKSLQVDREIQEAIDLLSSNEHYQALLKKI